jgi:hypothetical protein
MRLIDIALVRMRQPASVAAVGLVVLLLSATASLAVRAAEPAQQTFATPEEAAAALAAAWSHEEKEELLKIFGTGGAKLIDSGDPVADDNARQLLAAEYNASHKIDHEGDAKAVLSIGREDFPCRSRW